MPLMVFMLNISTSHAITYTNFKLEIVQWSRGHVAWGRGTQRRFRTKYIENTFQATQSTFRSVEIHSKWRFKICISPVRLGQLGPFRNYKGWVLFFWNFSMKFDVLRKWDIFWFLSPSHLWIRKFSLGVLICLRKIA